MREFLPVAGLWLFVCVPSVQGERLAFEHAHPKDMVLHMAFSQDGKRLLSVSLKEVKVYDIPQFKLVRTIVPTKGRPGYSAFSKKGDSVIVSTRDAPPGWTLYRFDLDTGKESTLLSSGADETVMALWPDREQVVLHGIDPKDYRRVIKRVDWASGKTTITRLPFPVLSTVLFSPDRKLLLTQGDFETEVVDLETGKTINGFRMDMKWKSFFLIAPDNRTLVTCHKLATRDIVVWDLESGRKRRTIELNGPPNDAAALCPKGKMLLFTHSGSVFSVDLKEGVPKRREYLSAVTIRVVVFAPDGQSYATGDNYGWLHLFTAPGVPKEGGKDKGKWGKKR